MRIFNNKSLIAGVEHLKGLAKVVTDRDVYTDINIMLGELKKVEVLVNNPHIHKVEVSCDMWEECLTIMDKVVNECGLDYEVRENDSDFNGIVSVYVVRKGDVI